MISQNKNTEELLNSAKYFLSHKSCECDPVSGVLNCIGCDINMLATYVVNTIKEDDNKSVTVDWVERETPLINKSRFYYTREYIICIGLVLVAEACPGGFNPCRLWLKNENGGYTVIDTTRGYVRKLLEILKIRGN